DRLLLPRPDRRRDRRGAWTAGRHRSVEGVLRDAGDAAGPARAGGGRPMTCSKETWLGSYVLDALEPAETEEVRAHVAGCATCQDVMVRLAWIPALLRTVRREDVERLDDECAAPDGTPGPTAALERPLASVRGARSIRRVGRPLAALLGIAVVAAALRAGTA